MAETAGNYDDVEAGPMSGTSEERLSAMEADMAEIKQEIGNGFPALRAQADQLLDEEQKLNALLSDAQAENEALRARVQELEAIEPDRWTPVRRAMTGDWVDDMRQLVERRLGVEAGDPAVVEDEAYRKVLAADRLLEHVRDIIEEAISGVEGAS